KGCVDHDEGPEEKPADNQRPGEALDKRLAAGWRTGNEIEKAERQTGGKRRRDIGDDDPWNAANESADRACSTMPSPFHAASSLCRRAYQGLAAAASIAKRSRARSF